MSLKDEAVYLDIENIKSDIKQIEYYSGEEQKLFAQISNHLKSIKNNYVSPSSSSFTTIGESIMKRRDEVKTKRNKYNEVLKRNIDIYVEATNESVSILSKKVDLDE